MVIEVRQTKADLKKEFKIYCDGKLQYTGKQSELSSRNPSWLYKLDGSVRFKSSESKKAYWHNRMIGWSLYLAVFLLLVISDTVLLMILATVILLFLLTLIPTVGKVCAILDDSGEHTARFYHIVKGLSGYYSMECGSREYRLYILDYSHYQYISVFHGDAQVAQINKDLHTANNKDNYTLYLLDEEAAMADLLTMFVLYFDNYEYGGHRKVFVGYKKNRRWGRSKADRIYDETWLPAHFGWNTVEGSGYFEE